MHHEMLKVLFSIWIHLQCIYQAIAWKYGPNGEDDWGRKYPECDKNRQSPVNIKIMDTNFNGDLHPLKIYISFDPRPTGITTQIIAGNSGHAIFISFGDIKMYLSGSNFPRAFQIANAHFHWGANSREGSEHLVDSTRFPLELHIVSFDVEKYFTIADAMNGTDSIAVIGVLFELSKKDNPYLEPITSNAKKMLRTGDQVALDNFDIMKLLPESYETKYYRYLGSLTTPPCSESVVWTTAKMRNYVSERQVAELRNLYDYYNETLARNWRREHPLGTRKVERSFQWGSSGVEIVNGKIWAILLVSAAAIFAILK